MFKKNYAITWIVMYPVDNVIHPLNSRDKVTFCATLKINLRDVFLLLSSFLEIEDFLTEQECDDIIFMAQTQGLEKSMTLGEQIPVGEEGSVNKTAERLIPEDPADTFQQLDTNFDGQLDVGEVGKRHYVYVLI